MEEQLTSDEKAQFDSMKVQEPVDQAALVIEKEQPAEVEQPKVEQPEVKEKFVPHGALAEERAMRKEAEKRADEAQRRADERLKAIESKFSQPQPPQRQEIPDPEKDALGAVKATVEEVRELRQFREQQVQQQQQQQQVNAIMHHASVKEAEFVKENPDYNDAGTFLKMSRQRELEAMGMSPIDAHNTIARESLGLAAAALQQGKNPAEVVYSLAKSRGYAKAAPVNNDTDKLARIAEGQKANISLGNVPGTPGKPQMNAKDLLAMDDDEFSTWLEKKSDSERQKYLGG